MKTLEQKILKWQQLLLLVGVLLGLCACGGDSNSKRDVGEDIQKDIPIEIPNIS